MTLMSAYRQIVSKQMNIKIQTTQSHGTVVLIEKTMHSQRTLYMLKQFVIIMSVVIMVYNIKFKQTLQSSDNYYSKEKRLINSEIRVMMVTEEAHNWIRL
jgi:hypothetical protein